jgi:hypothetical protein
MKRAWIGLLISLWPAAASAQAHDYAKKAPPPYSVPFQLRPAVVPNAVRLDTSFAPHNDAATGEKRFTTISILTGAVRFTKELGAIVRIGFDANKDSANFTNPVVGGQYLLPIGEDLRLAFFLGVAMPLGQGGGDDPNFARIGTHGAAALTRNAFDNALFAPNYLTIFPGVSFAYVANNMTVQVEATVFEQFRARGPTTQETRTNFTTGLHFGYFVLPELSLGAELRYQRFLKHEAPTQANDKPGVDTVNFSVGARGHFKIADKHWFRPGLAYARGLDKPMTDQNYNIIQVDLLFIF